MNYFIIPGLKDRYKRTFEDIVFVVCCHFKIESKLLSGRGRQSNIVAARHTAMYLLRKAGYTWMEIGKYFRKDHTTAIHAFNSIEGFLSIQDQKVIHSLKMVDEGLVNLKKIA